MSERSKTLNVIKRDPISTIKAAYLLLSSINYLVESNGAPENSGETINIIDSIFYDAIAEIEKDK
ncbi:hypothetical protein CRV02_12880 [Arcobacter sp. CECT 8989]|uniref:hypothetical protein n=1 Tax=Arcobacter sp. CECT 8989 TaxID=2044509 RepID=UPI00100BE936|nr:hypothetical protein [Arcobacter sp. CECT 8989]RXJ98939.1 hypothetical protein CRV02_12880 [Arcobacter sp. CECT 8989]